MNLWSLPWYCVRGNVVLCGLPHFNFICMFVELTEISNKQKLFKNWQFTNIITTGTVEHKGPSTNYVRVEEKGEEEGKYFFPNLTLYLHGGVVESNPYHNNVSILLVPTYGRESTCWSTMISIRVQSSRLPTSFFAKYIHHSNDTPRWTIYIISVNILDIQFFSAHFTYNPAFASLISLSHYICIQGKGDTICACMIC